MPHRLRGGHGDFGAYLLRKNLVDGINTDKAVYKNDLTKPNPKAARHAARRGSL